MSIEDGLDKYELLIAREALAPNSLLFLIQEFWSGWADSAVHNWNFYEPLGKDDWPRLARRLLDDSRGSREVSDLDIVSKFSVVPRGKRGSLVSSLWEIIRGKAI